VNIPDRWVVVKITTPGLKTVYKVFAVWMGGVFETDYWRLNSGIKGVEVGENAVLFKGYSGSEYYCVLDYYGLNGYGENTLNYIKSKAARSTVEILPATTDWKALV
jgi:hypothetical protein